MDTEALKRLMAEQQRKEKGGLSWEDILALNKLNDALESVTLEQLLAKKEEAKSDVDKAIERLKAGGTLGRAIKKVKAKPRKQHWRTAKRKRRQYYEAVAEPRRRSKVAEQIKTAEGWWEYLTYHWKIRKQKVDMTFEEWESALYPAVAGSVFVLQRYDSKLPIALDNVYAVRTANGEVLFDGKEHKLRTLGYIL